MTTGEPRTAELLGLIDVAGPVRSGAPAMIAALRAAGVRPVMITGDHPARGRAGRPFPAQSTVFITLTFAQLAVAVALRPKAQGSKRNCPLLAAVGLDLVLALLAVSWGPLRELLRTSTLSPADLDRAVIAGGSGPGAGRGVDL